jgi:hypothetical protein
MTQINQQVNIPINVTSRYNFFRMYVELIKDFPPLNKLSPKEREYVSLIMYYLDIYKKLPNEEINDMIASKREDIAKQLNMQMPAFYNMTSKIRSKGVMNGDTFNLHKILTINPDENFKLSFVFNITNVNDLDV